MHKKCFAKCKSLHGIIKQTGVRMIHPQYAKCIYKNSTTKIILLDERMNAFPLRSGIREGFTLLPLLFNILARTIRPKRKCKKARDRKGWRKVG